MLYAILKLEDGRKQLHRHDSYLHDEFVFRHASQGLVCYRLLGYIVPRILNGNRPQWENNGYGGEYIEL